MRLHLYVADVDAVMARAAAAGATILRPVADQFYGDRSDTIEDPFGHVWIVGTKQEQLTTAELEPLCEDDAGLRLAVSSPTLL